MGMRVGQVALYAKPHTKGAPDNLVPVFVYLINKAPLYLETAMQELETKLIFQFSIKAYRCTTLIDLVINQIYLNRPPSKSVPKSPARPTFSHKHESTMIKRNTDRTVSSSCIR